MLDAIGQFFTSNLLPSDWLTGNNIAMIPLYFLAVALVVGGLIQALGFHKPWIGVVTVVAGIGVGIVTYCTRDYLTTMYTFPAHLYNKDERVSYLTILTGVWVLISLALIFAGRRINALRHKVYTNQNLKPVSYWGRFMMGAGMLMQTHTIMMTAEILDIRELVANETCTGTMNLCSSHASTNLIPTWMILIVLVVGLVMALRALPGFFTWINDRRVAEAERNMPQINTFASTAPYPGSGTRDRLL